MNLMKVNMNTLHSKLLNSEKLSEDELLELVFEYSFDDIVEGEGRWNQSMRTIVKVEDRYFSIRWQRANTEAQEHYFHEQPEEVKVVQKVITVNDYIEI